jgi:hypothetical protein
MTLFRQMPLPSQNGNRYRKRTAPLHGQIPVQVDLSHGYETLFTKQNQADGHSAASN